VGHARTDELVRCVYAAKFDFEGGNVELYERYIVRDF
jgi:hypothetical protein